MPARSTAIDIWGENALARAPFGGTSWTVSSQRLTGDASTRTTPAGGLFVSAPPQATIAIIAATSNHQPGPQFHAAQFGLRPLAARALSKAEALSEISILWPNALSSAPMILRAECCRSYPRGPRSRHRRAAKGGAEDTELPDRPNATWQKLESTPQIGSMRPPLSYLRRPSRGRKAQGSPLPRCR